MWKIFGDGKIRWWSKFGVKKFQKFKTKNVFKNQDKPTTLVPLTTRTPAQKRFIEFTELSTISAVDICSNEAWTRWVVDIYWNETPMKLQEAQRWIP